MPIARTARQEQPSVTAEPLLAVARPAVPHAVAELRAKATAARRRSLPLALPQPRAGVRLNRRAIEHVIAALEIRDPVQIKWDDDLPDGWTGCHSWLRQGRHLIKLRPNRPADQVGGTILHELVHSDQAEDHGSQDAWYEAYARPGAAAAYEREARETSHEFLGAFLLAVRV
jgi:hypothetical protein